MSNHFSKQRLFFALWPPDDDLRRALAALRAPFLEKAKGRAVNPANLHVTLAFLGEVPTALVPRLIAGADKIHGEAFELVLDCVCNWRHNGILWAGMEASQACEPLQHLVHELRRMQRNCGLKPEKRAYQAHLTLLRDFYRGPPQPLAVSPVTWPVNEFVLVESRRESGRLVYEVLRRWPLQII